MCPRTPATSRRARHRVTQNRLAGVAPRRPSVELVDMVRKNASIVSAIAIKIPGQAPRVNPAPTNIPSTNKSMPTANTKPELLGVWPTLGHDHLANAYMNPTSKTKPVTMATKWWLATRSGINSTATALKTTPAVKC